MSPFETGLVVGGFLGGIVGVIVVCLLVMFVRRGQRAGLERAPK